MGGPNVLPRAQTHGVIRNIILDVREQIFVDRDSKSGRSAFPFNLKGAADVEVGERADLSFLSFDLAIASDAGQMASDYHNDTRSKQNDRDLSHVKYAFSVMMLRHHVLDSSTTSRRL